MAIQANDITVKLTVQDDATPALNRVQRELDQTGREGREAFDKVDRSAEKAGRELRDFEGKADRTRLSVAKLATGLVAIGAAFEGIRRSVGAGLGFIEAASEFEEAAAKFGVVFGDEAQRVALEFEELSSVVRRSQVELVTAASSFQDLFVPMGLTRQQAADLSTEMVKLAVDVASFNNAQDVDVIRNFQSALVGETEAVRKYGVLLDEARLKQLAYQNGIAEAGEELTQQQKVLARIIALYADTADAQGDAARTADSFANTIKGIRGAAKDLEVVFGQELVAATREVLEELGGVEGTTDLIKVAFAAATTVTEKFIRSVGAVLSKLKGAIDELGGADKVVAALRGELELSEDSLRAFAQASSELPDVLTASFNVMISAAKVAGRAIAKGLVGEIGGTFDREYAKFAAKAKVVLENPISAAGALVGGVGVLDITDQDVINETAKLSKLTRDEVRKAFEGSLEGLDLTVARGRLLLAFEDLTDPAALVRIASSNIEGGINGSEEAIQDRVDLYLDRTAALLGDTRDELDNRLQLLGDVDPITRQRVIDAFAQAIPVEDLEGLLRANAEKISRLDFDLLKLSDVFSIDPDLEELQAAADRAAREFQDVLTRLSEGLSSAVGDVKSRDLKVSDFFKVPETNEIVSFVTDFFSKVQQVQNQKVQELAAAFGIKLFDLDEEKASGRAVKAVRNVAATLGAESEEPMSAAGRKAGLAFNRALAKAAEDFVPAEDPLLAFLDLSVQADQVATLNSILAGTFDEAAAQVTDYYDGLREAAIARANSSRESQELLQKELELLGRLEERDLRLARIQEDRMTLAGQLGAMLNEQKIQQDLVNQSVQAFDQLVGGLAQSFVDSEASFADFRDQFIQSIAQMIVKALLLLAIQAALGAADLGAFGDVLKLAAGLPAEGKRKGGVIPNVGSMSFGSAPGVTKGDQGFHDTFFFAKGGVMPIHKYATGGVARTPQLAVFGEGRGAEAFVPLPDGARIPVKMDGGAQDVTVNLSVQSLDPRGAADVVLQQMPLIRREIAGALREGSDRTLLEGVRGASRR